MSSLISGFEYDISLHEEMLRQTSLHQLLPARKQMSEFIEALGDGSDQLCITDYLFNKRISLGGKLLNEKEGER